jgi:anti-sigma B factor antagonist
MIDNEPLAITSSLEPDRARIFVRGELDLATAPELRREIENLLSDGHRRPLVIIDMGDVTFCDSSGLQALLLLAEHSHRVGINFRLSNLTANVQRVFELTGTTRLLSIDVSRRS